MLIATWNVNSVRARLPRLLPWLKARRPDVVCLQETKVVDEDFPVAELAALGYRASVLGQKTYNGVAILSLAEQSDVVRGLPDDAPGADRRLIAATVAGVRVVSLYCPNGGEVGSDKYAFKLDWFARLDAFLAASGYAAGATALCGDVNVAPEDRDVWDPELWRGQTLCTDAERQAFRNVLDAGFVDTLRLHRQEGGIYSW